MVYLKYYIEHIEKVQRHFTKRLCGFGSLLCDECLKRFNVDGLEQRRPYFDLSWIYKILFVLVHVD